MEDKTLSDTSLGLFVGKGIPPVGLHSGGI